MFFQSKLVILVLALILDGQVYAGGIYGGHEAVPHSRPYMVLLKLHLKNNIIQYCGGFLLNEDFVMTAAHCQAKSYTIILGLHNFHDKDVTQQIDSEEKFPHIDYDANELKNDIMLLKLKSKAHFNNNVKPIPLPDQDDSILPKSCIVSGWGRNDRHSNLMTAALMEVNVTLTDNKLCPNEKLYCSEGEIGPGKGDSGGPLVCEDGKAYGVVSASVTSKERTQDQYYYTKIPEYRTWINEIMEQKYLRT